MKETPPPLEIPAALLEAIEIAQQTRLEAIAIAQQTRLERTFCANNNKDELMKIVDAVLFCDKK